MIGTTGRVVVGYVLVQQDDEHATISNVQTRAKFVVVVDYRFVNWILMFVSFHSKINIKRARMIRHSTKRFPMVPQLLYCYDE